MSTFNSATTTTPNFDNLLLQSLMGRLNLGPSRPNPSPLPSQSFEDFLTDHLTFSSSEDEQEYELMGNGGPVPTKSQLAREESRLEKEIIKVILSGKTESLKPNSGQAVSIGEHHVCVGYHEEEGGCDYRVWEWHGHIMLFDEDDGYTPEYIYGNYFERLFIGGVGVGSSKKRNEKKVEKEEVKKEEDKEKVSKVEENLGLRELIDGESENENGGLGKSRILHRSLHAGSPSIAVEGSVEK